MVATPYALLPLFTGVLLVWLGVRAWRRRSTPVVGYFVAMVAAQLAWVIGYAFEVVLTDPVAMTVAAKFSYLGIVSVAPTLLLVVLHLTGREGWVTRRTVAAVFVVPAITLAAQWLPTRLVWDHVSLTLETPFPAIVVTHGPLFWVHVAYAYLLLTASTILLVAKYVRTWRTQWSEAVVLLPGMAAPWAANLIFLTGVEILPAVDLTSFAFSITAAGCAWGLSRRGLLMLLPVTRAALLEEMSDGVIVVDGGGRLMEINAAAREALSIDPHPGQPSDQAFEAFPVLLGLLDASMRAGAEIVVGDDERKRSFDVQVSPLRNARTPRMRGGRGGGRPRSPRPAIGRTLRPRADGLHDAGDGRSRSHDSVPAHGTDGAAHPRHRAHRQCDARRPRALPRGRHGRLSRQAAHPRCPRERLGPMAVPVAVGLRGRAPGVTWTAPSASSRGASSTRFYTPATTTTVPTASLLVGLRVESIDAAQRAEVEMRAREGARLLGLDPGCLDRLATPH